MSTLIAQAASDLAKRESPVLVAAAGLLFKKLTETVQSSTLEQVLESHRGGVWGDAAALGYGYPVLRSTNMRGTKADIRNAAWLQVPDGVAARYALKTGDILVTKSSGSADLVGKAVLFSHPGDDRTYLFSNFTLRLRPALSRIEPRYLAWFLRSPQALLWRFEAQQNAVGLRNLSTSAYLDQHVPVPDLVMQRIVADYLDSLEIEEASEVELPSVLAEPRRIVARIEELTAKIEEARGLWKQTAAEAEAMLPSCLHRIFETEARGWMPLPMQEAIAMNDRQVDPTLPEYSRLPHISGDNMESKTCRLLSYRTADQDGVRSGNYLFSEGTILYSKIRPYLQKAVYVDFEGVCSADIYPIKVINHDLEPRFVMWNFVAGPFTEYANRLSGRTRMPKLNRKQLFKFPFTHPPLPEQRRVVAYLEELQAKVDSLKRLQAETAAELDAMLPSILDKAFKGEL